MIAQCARGRVAECRVIEKSGRSRSVPEHRSLRIAARPTAGRVLFQRPRFTALTARARSARICDRPNASRMAMIATTRRRSASQGGSGVMNGVTACVWRMAPISFELYRVALGRRTSMRSLGRSGYPESQSERATVEYSKEPANLLCFGCKVHIVVCEATVVDELASQCVSRIH